MRPLFGSLSKEMMFPDFVVKKEHLFLRNIYDEYDLIKYMMQ